jgi:protein-S-isoprenylcysteine O-methyltransferase Ste14
MTSETPPKLLKARRWHSQIFAATLILLILVSAPARPHGDFTRLLLMLVGYTFVIVGALGRGYCSAYIGGRKNDEVVRVGPFSVVRNPLYVFSFLAALGVGLQSGMFTLTILLGGAFLIYYPAVVRKEEEFLYHKFGEPYLAYMREVPRWIPNFSLWNEPERIESMPKFIRRTLMDAAVFFVPLPCFILLDSLHMAGILPVWLTLQ